MATIPSRLHEPKTHRAVVKPPPRCLICRDAAIVPTQDALPAYFNRGLCERDLRRELDAGTILMCLCEGAQWWVSWMEEERIATGREMPQSGIPDGLLRGERAVEWLGRWVQAQGGRA